MTIEENLDLLEQTKNNIRAAINKKNPVLNTLSPFSSYTDAIDGIVERNFRSYLSSTGKFSIAIPPTTTAIRRGFDGVTGLTAVTIPDSVERLENGVFSGSGLVQVEIPSSVNYVGASVFRGCNSLKKATINCALTNNTMFSGCTALTEVIMPNITQINVSTFGKCTALTSVTIPDSCTTIGENAFDSCKALKNVSIGSGCTSIGNRAFYGAYPNTVDLETLTITATTPPSIGTDAIGGTAVVIYVPAESLEAYKTAWTAYETKIQAIPA